MEFSSMGWGKQMGSGGAKAIVLGASFDGTNDLMLRGADLTGNADSKVGIIATRLRFNGGDSTFQYIIQSAGGAFYLVKSTTNKIRVYAENSVGTRIMQAATSTSVVISSGYVNVLIAWDLATSTIQLYLEDVSDISIAANTDDIIDYTRTEHSIGATTGAGSKLNADINFLYVNYAETLDFSTEANRRKFFDASGGVADMGADGSTPTGTAPIIFQQGLYDQWETNKGGGGGFTVTGALSQPVD